MPDRMKHKISGRNIKNLRYVDDTTFTAESKEELQSLLIKVIEDSEKLAQNSTFNCELVIYLISQATGR